MDWRTDDGGLLRRVSPFRHLRIAGYLLLPEAFRSLSRLSSALSAKASALRSLCLTICIRASSVMRGGLLILLIKHHLFRCLPIFACRYQTLSCSLTTKSRTFENFFKLYMYAVFKVHLVRGAREACFRGARAFLSRALKARCSADFISHQNTQ